MLDNHNNQLDLFDEPTGNNTTPKVVSMQSNVHEKALDKVDKYISEISLNSEKYGLKFYEVEYREDLVSKITLKIDAPKNTRLHNTKFTIFIGTYKIGSYYDTAAEQEYDTIQNKSLSAIQLINSTKGSRFIGKDGSYINSFSYFSYLDRAIIPDLIPFIGIELDRAIIHFHYQKNNRVNSLAK